MSEQAHGEQSDNEQIARKLRDHARDLIQAAEGTPGSVGKRELYEAAAAALDAAWVAQRGKR